MKIRQLIVVPLAVVTLTGFASACSSSGSSGSAASTPSTAPTSQASTPSTSTTQPPTGAATTPPKPVATESNPPGDIPDNQAYVAFQPPGGGYSVKVPEGWARSTAGAVTSFGDKLNRIQVGATAATAAPTPQSVNSQIVPALQRQVPKFAMGKVSEISRPAGKVVLVTYQGDSSPDPVTGKVVRDAFEQYLFFQNGKLVTLTLSGPTNADNVDPWKIVTESMRWA
ncbi:MAG TPA: hypothetical protein VGD15_06770 [Kribbella sp.]